MLKFMQYLLLEVAKCPSLHVVVKNSAKHCFANRPELLIGNPMLCVAEHAVKV